MDLPEVKAFNAELSGLYDNKPPISKAKMSAITKGAIKAIKVYKHVVHSVEKFIQKCKPEYKVPGLYVIDSIVRQSRHQFGQDKDVFAPRFAKNMQQTFANLFRCPPEDKRNIIRVLNLWQKNNVFSPQVIQPLMDMADPSHPLHQEIQQQQNSTANGSSLNISHNTSDKISPGGNRDSPHMSSPMGGDQFQDEPSGQPNLKFRKLLNDFEYDSEDEQMMDAAPLPPSSHSHSTSHTSHSTSHATSHSTSHTTHTSSHSQNAQQPVAQNPADAMASILTNPEIMRQLHSLQAQMQMMTGLQLPNLMPMMTDMQQMQQNPNQNLPFLNSQAEQQKLNDAKDEGGNNESDIEFVDAGPTVIEIPDANDSRSPSPKSRRRWSRSKSPRRRRRGSRSRSRSPRRRRDRERDRDRDRDRDKDREKDRERNNKEREAEREKQKEREKKGLPPIKKENLSVCSTTLWVGHLSKLATPEELSDLFGAVGGVQHIDVVAPRGCAFVVMERRRDAHKAKLKLNKHKLHSKEITVAWAPGKGVKSREWKDYWEAELGVSYLPWNELHVQWSMGALSLDAFEDGGVCDEDTLPPWLPPRIMPKSLQANMSMLGVGMLPLPPAMPPHSAPDMSVAGRSPLSGVALPPGMPPMPGMPLPRMPPPGMPAGMPPGMAPGMPPGIRPPSLPTGVPGVQTDAGLPPNPMIRFPPGMPPQPMPQPGMVGGFPLGNLGGLLGVGGLLGGVPVLHLPPAMQHHHPAPAQQRPAETNQTDDAMDLDTEEHTEDAAHSNNDTSMPPALLPDQIQALLSKPPPAFNASEPPPGFNASEPPPFTQPPPTEDKQDDERKDRDRRDRDRDRDRDRRDRDRGRDRDRDGRDQRRDRDRGNERRGERDRDGARDGGRDERRERDRERGGRRDRERDRERDRLGGTRDGNRSSREKSPRAANEQRANNGDNPEKSLQERLWEMANGKTASNGPRAEDKPRDEPREREREDRNESVPEPSTQGDNGPEATGADPGGPPPGWVPPAGPRPPLLGPPFRAELRMRGPPRPPMAGGPWMDGPPGPPGPGPFGPRFNGMGPPPFNRPPFERPPFDGPPMFDGPPRFDRPPFNRMPFDMNRPPFDGPRPPFDGPRPPFDGPRPPFDGPRPPFDGPRPPFDGPRPPFDGPMPPFDGSRPPFDGPPFDGPRPLFDGPPFEGDRSFDGPPEFFDRNNRRFEDREQFNNERGWDRRDRPDWDRRDRHSRDREDRFNRRDDRNDRSQGRRSFDDRPRNDRQRDDRPRDDKPRDERTRDDKPRDERTRDDKPRDERTRDDKPRDERLRDERPREDRSRDDKREDRSKDDRSRDDRQKDERSREDKPREERRRDKDRKSRWGAAEENVAEEPKATETQASDHVESNISSEAPVAMETQPVEINETVESVRHNEDEERNVPETIVDEGPKEAAGDTRMEVSIPKTQDEIPLTESKEDGFPQMEDNYDHNVSMEEPVHETHENKEPVIEPVVEPPPLGDLYDAGDAIDTSFAPQPTTEVTEASKETEKAPEAPTEPAEAPLNESNANDDIFDQRGDSTETPDVKEGAA